MDKPAIAGGKPIRTEKNSIMFNTPMIENEEINTVIETLKSGWIGNGPKTEQFEHEFMDTIGSKHAIATNSGTAALHLALLANSIGKGDEVIVTPMTFAATVNAIEYVGAKPVFADIELNSYNINPDEIRKKITNKTKAIMPVHLYGLPCKMDEIIEIAEKNNLKVIDDAAHAAGSEYMGKKIGNLKSTTCFSFFPTKSIATPDGGMITTNDDEIAAKAKLLRWHGLELNSVKASQTIDLGFKYTMSDVSASMGICQLKKLDNFIKIKERCAKTYKSELHDIDEITLPPEGNSDFKNSWHIFAILLKPELLKIDRNEMVRALRAENIGTGIHYLAVHLHPYYKEKYGFKTGDFPNAEFVSERTFSLSMSPKLTQDDIRDITTAVKRIINYFRK